MITELNRFLIWIGNKKDIALKEAQNPTVREDYQYNNGYYQALEDAHEVAKKIYHDEW